jgi:hypothetical protein
MACSARSLGEERSSSSRRRSSASSRPRGLVPAMGRVRTLAPTFWKSRSGLPETTAQPSPSRSPMKGEGFWARRRA